MRGFRFLVKSIKVMWKTIKVLYSFFVFSFLCVLGFYVYKIISFINHYLSFLGKLFVFLFFFSFSSFSKEKITLIEYNNTYLIYDYIKGGVSIDNQFKYCKPIDCFKKNKENKIKGTIKTKKDNKEIFNIVRYNLFKNEGVRLKAYHLDGEYYYKNKQKHKLYTICQGQTTIKDKKGKIIRYINEKDKFTMEQCFNLFVEQYEHYNKMVYQSLTDNQGNNYYNSLTNYEIAAMIELVWWMGKRGSVYITSAMINYSKYRTQAGYKRLIKAFHKYSKKCKPKFKKGCEKRKQSIIKTLNGEIN